LKVRILFAVLKPIGDDAKGESLRLGGGFCLRNAIGKDARNFANFGQPTPVGFPLDFKDELHFLTSSFARRDFIMLFNAFLFH
jgi:hypothetical protein